jgi:hypothetical protein
VPVAVTAVDEPAELVVIGAPNFDHPAIVACPGLGPKGGNLVESAGVELGMREKARTIRSTWALVGIAFASMVINACAEANQPSAADPTTTTSEPAVPPTSPIDVDRVLEHFTYYGACGNETVAVGNTTYYPVLRRHLDEIDEARYPLDDDAEPSGLLRVVPPGPGDDVGTMILYSDGMARFESESGRIIWLTNEEQTYNWVC